MKNSTKFYEINSDQTQRTHISLNRNDSLKCAHLASQAAVGKNAENLKILDLASCGGFTDFFVICSGTSDRQVKTIADAIEETLGQNKIPILSTEGKMDGRWIVMDCGGVLVHVFLDALRSYYSLENLWSDATECEIPAEFYASGGSPLN